VLDTTFQAQSKKPWQRRLLAEAVRLYEKSSQQQVEDIEAVTEAIRRGGSFEDRLLTRAEHLNEADELNVGLNQVKRSVFWVFAGLVILALVSGLAASKWVLFKDSAGLVNFYGVLLGLLGLPTLSLFLWIISLFLGTQAVNISSLGGLTLKLSKWLANRLHRDSITETAILAWSNLVILTRTGRWLIGTFIHGIWLAFLLGSLFMTLLLLSTRQYDFNWETTILSDAAFIGLTDTLSALPATLGFNVPDTDLIITSRLQPGLPYLSDSGRETWSELLIASLLIYGLLPRLIAMGICLLLAIHSLRNTHLNLEHHGFANLHSRLVPVARVVGVVDPDTAFTEENHLPPETRVLTKPIKGDLLIVGIDIDTPIGGWPPALGGNTTHDLGIVTDRESRARVVRKLQEYTNSAGLLVVVCSLATTPDRGIGRFIRRLQELTAIRTLLLLTQGTKLRRNIDVTRLQQRLSDWQRIGVQHGLNAEDFLEVDLDDSSAVTAFRNVIASRFSNRSDMATNS
jgi:hypothetical protein